MAFRNMTTWFFLALRVVADLRAARPALAQLQSVRDGFGSALVLVFMIGFFWGIIKIWEAPTRSPRATARARAASLPASSSPLPPPSWRRCSPFLGCRMRSSPRGSERSHGRLAFHRYQCGGRFRRPGLRTGGQSLRSRGLWVRGRGGALCRDSGWPARRVFVRWRRGGDPGNWRVRMGFQDSDRAGRPATTGTGWTRRWVGQISAEALPLKRIRRPTPMLRTVVLSGMLVFGSPERGGLVASCSGRNRPICAARVSNNSTRSRTGFGRCSRWCPQVGGCKFSGGPTPTTWGPC